jgi:hypothetical protein
VFHVANSSSSSIDSADETRRDLINLLHCDRPSTCPSDQYKTLHLRDCWQHMYEANSVHKQLTIGDIQRGKGSVKDWYQRFHKSNKGDTIIIAVDIPSDLNKRSNPGLLAEGGVGVDLYKLQLFYEYGIRYFIDRLWTKQVKMRIQLLIRNGVNSVPATDRSSLSSEQQAAVVRYLQTHFGGLIDVSTGNSLLEQFHKLAEADGVVTIPDGLSLAASFVANAEKTIVPRGSYGQFATYLENNFGAYFKNIDVDALAKSTIRLDTNTSESSTLGQDLLSAGHSTTLGWARGKLVDMTNTQGRSKHSAGSCAITQFGWDGFGHQVESKLSCILLAELWPSRFRYVHTGFHTFQHIDVSSEYIDNFLNFGSLGYEAFDIGPHLRGQHVRHIALSRTDLEHSLSGMLQPVPICSAHEPTIVDNCWDLVYREPIVSKLTNTHDIHRNAIISKIRQKYLETPKPDVGFSRFDNSSASHTSTHNVVVHMRHGDSGDRFGLDERKYFEEGIRYYIRRFDPTADATARNISSSTVRFWIETDSTDWEVYQYIIDTFANITVPTNSTDSVFVVFHRMVLADGIVMSPSSLSNAAVLLSQAEVFVICDCYNGIHGIWKSSSRFVTIK